MSTTQEIAGLAYGAFEKVKRKEPAEQRSIVTLKDGSPEWIKDAVYAAHDGGILPDDWTYEIAREAFRFLSECDDIEDRRSEFADNVDVYSSALSAWLENYPRARSCCREATEELGAPSDGDVDKLLQLGQYVARGYIFDAVSQACEDQSEESEDD